MKRQLRRLYKALKTYGKGNVDSKVIRLSPGIRPKGRVLVSYIVESFLMDPEHPVFRSHTHYWETRKIVNTFLELGYAVDVISYRNTGFRPAHDYEYFISARTNFARISSLLNESCKKVAHLDTAHWVTSNFNAYSRLSDLVERRHVALPASIRLIEHNAAIENADLATILGNEFTIDSYAYSGKEIHRIPISSPVTFDWQNRDINTIRNNYLWFGSSGFVHKGLDLALEVFAELPEQQLFVCGPFDKEKDFLDEFHRELFECSNIHPVGWVDVNKPKFKTILDQCIGTLYPSCAEGGGGSVITCMHNGLVPVLSYEASVDTGDFGVILDNVSLSTVRREVMRLSDLSEKILREMARETWEYTSRVHSKESFARKYREFVLEVLL